MEGVGTRSLRMQLAIRALISLKPIKIHNNQAAPPTPQPQPQPKPQSKPSHPTGR